MDGKLFPYEFGGVNSAVPRSFLFDIFLPAGYNHSPPHVKYMTVGPILLSPFGEP